MSIQLWNPNQKTDFEELVKAVRAFQRNYPFLSVGSIGKSILGKELPVLQFGTGKRKFLYVGAHHGMEWITTALLLKYVWELCKLYQSNARVENWQLQTIWQHCSIHVVPMLNPDGVGYEIHGVQKENPLYERVIKMNGGSTDFTHWQANARGVDLNHNYNAEFEAYKSLEKTTGIACGAPTRYSGEYPESEPEVRALCNYFRFYAPWKGVLTLHTQGKELFWQENSLNLQSKNAIRKIALECGYRLKSANGLAAYGGLTDWCAEVWHTPAITLECGKGVNPLPFSDFPFIYEKLRRVLFLAPTYF